MKRDRNAMKFPVQALALSVAVMLVTGLAATARADGYTYYDSNGFRQVYNGSGATSGSYPQYFPRIDPESTYQSQPTRSSGYRAGSDYTLKPLTPNRPIAASASKSHKALSTKISDGFSDLWKSSGIKSGVAGAGIGLGAAALTEHNLLRGSLIGGAYGLGVGLMDESYFFKRHPLIRRTAKGAAIGMGAAAVTTAASLAPAAAVGAGVGVGIHYLKTH